MKNEKVFIMHILESIIAIEDFSKDLTREKLTHDRLRQSAIIREIEVIGEAVKNISSSIKNKYKDVGWKEISGTRDILIHHYFGIDLDIIFSIVKKDIPKLKNQMLKIKKDLENKN